MDTQHSCAPGCTGHHTHKWLTRAAIVLAVFFMGFMMGQLQTMLRFYEHGTGMMRGDRMMNARVMDPGMMAQEGAGDTTLTTQ